MDRGSCQAPLSMQFSGQEYWSGLPFPPPGDVPDPGIETRSPALQADSLPTELGGKPLIASPGKAFKGSNYCLIMIVISIKHIIMCKSWESWWESWWESHGFTNLEIGCPTEVSTAHSEKEPWPRTTLLNRGTGANLIRPAANLTHTHLRP